jgi:hypothetical protein
MTGEIVHEEITSDGVLALAVAVPVSWEVRPDRYAEGSVLVRVEAWRNSDRDAGPSWVLEHVEPDVDADDDIPAEAMRDATRDAERLVERELETRDQRAMEDREVEVYLDNQQPQARPWTGRVLQPWK